MTHLLPLCTTQNQVFRYNTLGKQTEVNRDYSCLEGNLWPHLAACGFTTIFWVMFVVMSHFRGETLIKISKSIFDLEIVVWQKSRSTYWFFLKFSTILHGHLSCCEPSSSIHFIQIFFFSISILFISPFPATELTSQSIYPDDMTPEQCPSADEAHIIWLKAAGKSSK